MGGRGIVCEKAGMILCQLTELRLDAGIDFVVELCPSYVIYHLYEVRCEGVRVLK